MTKESLQGMNEKYMQFQFLEQELKQLQQKKQVIENQLVEFTNLGDNLREIKNFKEGSNMQTPIGSGIFLKSELKDKSNVLVNIGSNLVIERSIDEARETVKKQSEELKDIQEKIDKELAQKIEITSALHQEITELTKKNK
jgi:prefoldin alpha subunit